MSQEKERLPSTLGEKEARVGLIVGLVERDFSINIGDIEFKFVRQIPRSTNNIEISFETPEEDSSP